KPFQNSFKHSIDMEPSNLLRVKSISPPGISPPLPQGEDRGEGNIWFSSPAADAIDAFHQATDFCCDITWKVAAFSLNYFQRHKKFAIQLIRRSPYAFVNQIVE